MTRIGDAITPKASGGQPASKPEAPEKNDVRSKSGKETGNRLDRKTGKKAADADIFQQKMLHALRKGKVDDKPEGDTGKTLLVILHPGGLTESGRSDALAGAAKSQVNQPSHRIEWVEKLFSRIDRALQSDATARGGSVTLNLELATHEVDGLRGVEISMSPTALDVVLTRTEGQATMEYLAATQVLAERLQERFSRRIVRIHEVVDQARKASSPGLDKISEILENSEKRS